MELRTRTTQLNRLTMFLRSCFRQKRRPKRVIFASWTPFETNRLNLGPSFGWKHFKFASLKIGLQNAARDDTRYTADAALGRQSAQTSLHSCQADFCVSTPDKKAVAREIDSQSIEWSVLHLLACSQTQIRTHVGRTEKGRQCIFPVCVGDAKLMKFD